MSQNPYDVDFDTRAVQVSSIPWAKFEKPGDRIRGALVSVSGPQRNPTFGHQEYVYTFRTNKEGDMMCVSIKEYEREIVQRMSELKPGQFAEIVFTETVKTKTGKDYKKKVVRIIPNLVDEEIASGAVKAPDVAPPPTGEDDGDPFGDALPFDAQCDVAMAIARAKYGADVTREEVEKRTGAKFTREMIERMIEILNAA